MLKCIFQFPCLHDPETGEFENTQFFLSTETPAVTFSLRPDQ